MSTDGNNSNHVPIVQFLKTKSAAKRFREQSQQLAKERDDLLKAKQEADGLLKQLATAYKQLRDDPRLQLNEEQYSEFQNYQSQNLWQSHEDQFNSAMNGLLANGVTPTQILRAVGYAPEQVENLTPDIIQDVINTAYQEFPQLFQVVSSQNDQAEPVADESVPGQMVQMFEQGAVAQQPQREMFTEQQPQRVAQGQVPPPQAMRQPPQAVAGMQQGQAPPPVQFRGYGDLQGRGGPAPTKLPAMAARLRDPAWLAQNQGALAQAVASGAIIQSSDT